MNVVALNPNRWDPDNNFLHKAVLHYPTRLRWPIIPLWWVENGACGCGEPRCANAGKHPIGLLVPNGIRNAARDPETVIKWWTRYPKANIGIALGRISDMVVIDVDGAPGRETLEKLLAQYNHVMAPFWFVETGREDGGRHYYFRYPKDVTVKTRKVEGLEVRSDNAYVVAPPSVHYTGRVYTWQGIPNEQSSRPGWEDLPQCFIDFAAHGEKAINLRGAGRPTRGTTSRRLRLIDSASAIYSPPTYSETREKEVVAALRCIPADDYDVWLKMGMALHWTGWGERAWEIWCQWSQKSTKFNVADQQKKWESFGRPDRPGPVITLGSLFALAQEHGFTAEVEPAAEPDEPPHLKSQIETINERHFAIRNIGGKCLVGEMVPNPAGSGQMLSLQSIQAFRAWYDNQYVAVVDDKGNERRKPLGTYWIAHRKRRGYEGVDLVPNAPQELPDGKLNLWRGFGVEPKKGDWSLMAQHVCNVLAGRDAKAAEYISRWAAWSLQHPDVRAEVALALQGGKGSGKGVFLRGVGRCFGEHGMQITNQEHLVRRFNGHFRSCLFLFVEEAFWAGDKKGESVLKGLITEPTLTIELKGIDAVQWPNRLHVAMAANAEWIVPASAGERRYAVFKCADTYVRGHGDEEVSRAYFEALHHEFDNGGLEAMLFDLLHWDLGDWHPRQVYETEGLRRQKEQSLPPLAEWFVLLLEDGNLPGRNFLDGRKNFATTSALVEHARQRVPRLRHYLSDKAMGDFLSERKCTSDKNQSRTARGWSFPPLAQMRAEWSRQYGGWDWQNEETDWQ
jgi:Bifunctional DNA primase/polymerase, N-terminal/Primase C terminal 2 (PriCT-2)/Family of unknown function (DUF5906)